MKTVLNLITGETSEVPLNASDLITKSVWDAEEAQYLAEKPIRDWQVKMQQLDVIPRWAEDIFDAMSTTQQSSVSKFTTDKITAKKAHRLTRPV